MPLISPLNFLARFTVSVVRVALIFFTASAEYLPNIKKVAMLCPPWGRYVRPDALADQTNLTPNTLIYLNNFPKKQKTENSKPYLRAGRTVAAP